MTDEEKDPSRPTFHYEGGIPVFETRLSEVERKATASELRDEQYKNSQRRINFWLVVFTGLLVLTSVISGGISIWQARIANKSANAARDGAIAAKSAADTAEHSFQVEKRRAEDMEEAICQLNGGGTAARDNSFPVAITNLGKFTARKVEVHVEVSLNSFPSNKIIRVLANRDISIPEIAGQKNWTEKIELPLNAHDWDNIADTKEMIVQEARFRYENGFERIVSDSRCQIWAYFRTPQDVNNPVSGRGNDCRDLPRLLESIRKEQKP